MAVVLKAGWDQVSKYLTYAWTYADPRSAHLPMVRSPVPVAIILVAYLYFVISLGPRLMRHRRPYDVRKIMLVYNAVQVVWCGYLVREGWRLGWHWGGKYSFLCEPLSSTTEPHDYEVAWIVWLYFLLKIVDLLDTVFMVLRKNFRQISFLHVYHHGGMVFCVWLGTKVFPGGHHTLIGFINLMVHCMLYGYYFLSLWNPNTKVAWWKKYITLVQIAQFGINVVHEFIPLLMPTCEVDKRVGLLLVIQNLFMCALFTDFYVKSYVRRQPAHHDKKET